MGDGHTNFKDPILTNQDIKKSNYDTHIMFILQHHYVIHNRIESIWNCLPFLATTASYLYYAHYR